jgi:peptidoglycan/LPS O-acetylase OafA/YrhL
MQTKATPKIPHLEGLRGWMAIWVWVTHVSTMAGFQLKKNEGVGWVLANGEFAVAIFVVLSGFVISKTIAESWSGGRDFFVRRTFRLFPVYLICLGASVLILNLSIELLHDMPWALERISDRSKYLLDSKQYFSYHLILHALLLHGLIPDSVLPSSSYAFMGQAWSLSLEWQFYLVAPALFWLLNRVKLGRAANMILLLVLAIVSRKLSQPSFLPSNLFLFFVGYLCYSWYSSGTLSNARHFFVDSILLLSFAAIGGVRTAAIPFFILVLYAAVANMRHISKCSEYLFASKFPQFLGKISYSFYCVHMVAIFGSAYAIRGLMPMADKFSYGIALIITSLLVALALSMVLNRCIEMPAIEFGKRIAKGRKASIRQLLNK